MKMPNETMSLRDRGYMRPQEAAEYLGISRRKLQYLQAEGAIPYAVLGRRCVLFRRSELDKAIDRFTIHAVSAA